MLEIINRIKPFFEDNYRRINVREYARLQKISPPNASTLLKKLNKEELLNKEEENRYLYFYANRDKEFVTLQRLYYLILFKKIGMLEYLEKELVTPIIILFGSYAKGEINQNSDIDLAIFSASNKEVNLEKFENKLGKTIQVFSFRKKEDVKNKNLLNNILNGFILKGNW